jgi:hypothetical protein
MRFKPLTWPVMVAMAPTTISWMSGLTSDGGTTPVTTADVIVTDTVTAPRRILTSAGGESITPVSFWPG